LDDDRNPWKEKSLPWLYRIAGAVGVLGGVFGLYSSMSAGDSFGDTVYTGLSYTLGAAFIFFVPTILLITILETAIGYAREKKNPFVQGIAFAAMFLLLVLLFDLFFLQGMLIFTPVFWPFIDAFLNQLRRQRDVKGR
jgi:hypothetical protein